MSEQCIRMTLEGQYLAEQSFKQAEFDITKLARSATMMMGVFNSMIGSMMTMKLAQDSVQYAQERYNEAVAKSGPYSKAAIDAQRSMEVASSSFARAQLYSAYAAIHAVSTLMLQVKTLAGLGAAKAMVNASTVAGTGIEAAETAAKMTNTGATITQTAAEWGYVAALKARAVAMAIAHPWLIPLMLGGAAAVAGLTMTGAFQGPSTPSPIEASSSYTRASPTPSPIETPSPYVSVPPTLQSQPSMSRIEISLGGSVEFHIHEETDVDRAIDEYGSRLKSEYRRRTG